MIRDRNKVYGLVFGGAVGDMFGAPIEALNLKKIRRKHGPYGLQHPTIYRSHWDDGEDVGLGIVTDDTTTTAITLAGMIEAKKEGGDYWAHKALDNIWQYHLVWGAKQQFGEGIAQFVRPETEIPDYLQPFMVRCGAGKGTIASLLQGKRGDVHDPVLYDMVLGGKKCVGPNAGSGGMMRVAPIALYHDQLDLVNFSRRSAAITHGHKDAIAGTAVVASLVANSLKEKVTLKEALYQTKNDLFRIADNEGVVECFETAEKAFAKNRLDMEMMTVVGRAQNKNLFLAKPILAQTLFVTMVAAEQKASPQKFKNVMRLAVNHAGDSDTVGAIAGNIIGASWGYNNLPQDWIKQMPMRGKIKTLADRAMTP